MWIMSCWSYKNIHSFFSLVDLLFMLCHHAVNICNKAFGFAFYESCLLYRFYFPFCNFFLFFFFFREGKFHYIKRKLHGVPRFTSTTSKTVKAKQRVFTDF
jgi:hypothetical protein